MFEFTFFDHRRGWGGSRVPGQLEPDGDTILGSHVSETACAARRHEGQPPGHAARRLHHAMDESSVLFAQGNSSWRRCRQGNDSSSVGTHLGFSNRMGRNHARATAGGGMARCPPVVPSATVPVWCPLARAELPPASPTPQRAAERRTVGSHA